MGSIENLSSLSGIITVCLGHGSASFTAWLTGEKLTAVRP